MISFLENLPKIVNCHAGQFFLLTDNILTEKEMKKLTLQKTVIDNHYIDVMILQETDVQTALFTTLKEAALTIQTQKY